jgi:hypothetical protein
MSPYDDAMYTVPLMMGPLLGSFASVIVTGTNKTATSVNVTDRAEFFRNIKVTGFKVITRASAAATAHAASTFSYKAILSEGTRVVATAALGTVAGIGTSGGVSATYANIDSTEELQLRWKIGNDGTAVTHAILSYDAWIEYKHRR